MKRLLPLLILAVGLCLAAAFGARNGDTHTRYRVDAWNLANAPDQAEQIALPPPRQRLAEWASAGGAGWLTGVVLIGVGAVMARRQQKAASTRPEGGGDADLGWTLDAMLPRMEALVEAIAEMPMDTDAEAERAEIDAIFAELVEPLVDGRGRLIARHGMGTFAGYFGAFAGGERNLARCWSALTDGHTVEARASLDRALDGFRDARKMWDEAESATRG